MSAASAIPAERVQPRAIPRLPLAIALLLLAAGAAAFAAGLAGDPAAAWRAFHVNTLYWGALSQGALVLVCAFVIVGARWPGPVRRLAESLAAFVPATLVLAAVAWFGGREYIYPWLHSYQGAQDLVPWKDAWLNPLRLIITDLGVLALLAWLSARFLRVSLRPALHAHYGGGAAGKGFGAKLAARWIANWKGAELEAQMQARQLKNLAPVICIVYAIGWSLIAFDQVMSLEPTWFSNLFGAYFAWGGFLCAVGATALLAVLHRGGKLFRDAITADRLHDLGKMLFAFSIFWMYLFFSQYIVIWYGNLPEETQYFKDRLGTEFLMQTWYWEGWWERIWNEPWVKVTLFAWICIWFVPFWALLGQKPKRTPWFLAAVAVVSLIGFWVERNVLVWPSLLPQETWAFWGPVQLGVAAGFLGLFILLWLGYAYVFPGLAAPVEAADETKA